MAEFLKMNSNMKINNNEIMVEFIHLKWIWVQLQIFFSEGTNFTHPK